MSMVVLQFVDQNSCLHDLRAMLVLYDNNELFAMGYDILHHYNPIEASLQLLQSAFTLLLRGEDPQPSTLL